ncbi:MAG: phosphoribosylformylglycinamidine synthase subunit PurQ, partial [Firmicutes bacterium]|nr:phosphoribosylformylglycinamidine synthase subunit PurQ [Bacillota bacterium]
SRLEDVFPCNIPTEEDAPVETFTSDKKCTAAPAVKVAKPRVLIPAFPGTNSEYDSAKYSEAAGAEAKICVIRNLTPDDIQRSVEEVAEEIRRSQMIFIPGGFSGGDEPDGSGKFITAFFRNAAIKEAVTELLEKRDGLMLGVCNGFQALVKLGLVPYGKIIDTDENCPTVTFNKIGRLQSKIVRTRVCSVLSPWLAKTQVGDVYNVAISHGEGRFYASDELIHQLAANGQIAQQYVGLDGEPSMSVDVTPNGSAYAIEGITSPDGRVFGKMGHIERYSKGIFRNIPGNYDPKLMEAAVEYFTK